MLMAVHSQYGPDDLLFDSGASNHMVFNEKLLYNLGGIKPKKVLLGNGETLTAVESGTISFEAILSRTSDNEEKTLEL